FLADGGSGRLLRYKAFQAMAPDRGAAVEDALGQLDRDVASWTEVWRSAVRAREQGTLDPVWDPDAADFVVNPDGGPDLVPPRFFKRPSPAFTPEADRAHAVATVDLVVQFNADGSYGPIDVVRWAGFGLDESATEAVRACRFWPARRADKAV